MFSIKLHILLLFFVATLLTIISHTLIGKYQNISPQLLLNPTFSENLKGWQVKGEKGIDVIVENGILTLESQNKLKQIEVFQELAVQNNEDKFRVGAEFRVANVVAGEKNWNKARLLFVQNRGEYPDYGLPHEAFSQIGTHGWKTYSEIFSIVKDCHVVKVDIQLIQSSGKFFIRNPVLFRVTVNPFYVFIKWLVLSLWLVFYLCLLQSYWQSAATKVFKIFLGITVLVLLIGITFPGRVKNDLRSDLLREIKTCTVPVKQMVVKVDIINISSLKILMVEITHLAHFLLFSLLAFLLIRGNAKGSVYHVLTYLALIASSTELMQIYIEGRSPRVQDFLIDMAGGGVIVLVWYLIGLRKPVQIRERKDLCL
jgi:VanZ family protein